MNENYDGLVIALNGKQLYQLIMNSICKLCNCEIGEKGALGINTISDNHGLNIKVCNGDTVHFTCRKRLSLIPSKKTPNPEHQAAKKRTCPRGCYSFKDHCIFKPTFEI